MRILRLPGRGETATYRVGAGLLGRTAGLLKRHVSGRRVFVVSDEVVGPLYGRGIADQLSAQILEIPSGEEHKRWPSVEAVVDWLLDSSVERSDVVVAVGGGVVTDLAGFAASITLRGVSWVAVPTTLLAMVDAALGGKTGVDHRTGKNLLGTFWPPVALLADPDVLATLDRRHLRAGLAEVIKAAIIAPTVLEPLLDRHLATIARGELEWVEDVIVAAARVKVEIVAVDEREQGSRAALNLGHTLGHACEAATGYGRFLHGEAVAWGMLAALIIARNRGLYGTADAQSWASRIELLAPLPPLADLSWERLRPFVARDKKRTKGKVAWVLPHLGGVTVGVEVTEREAEAAFGVLCSAAPEGGFASLF